MDKYLKKNYQKGCSKANKKRCASLETNIFNPRLRSRYCYRYIYYPPQLCHYLVCGGGEDKKCLINVSTEIHVPLYGLQDDIVDRMINDWNALFFHLPFKFAYLFTHVGRRQIYYLTVHITTDYLQVNTKHLNNVGLRLDQHQKRYPAIN